MRLEINLSYKGSLYSFSRDQSGAGFWYCIRGTIPGSTGKGMGIAVPLMLANELNKEAIAKNLATIDDLSKFKSKLKLMPTKSKDKVKVSKKTKKNISGKFNPFDLFDNAAKEEEKIISSYEEIEKEIIGDEK